MMAVTTSTHGKGHTIVGTIRLLANNARRGLRGPRPDIIELAIGPRPINDFMKWWTRESPMYRGIQFRGHHAMPIGEGRILRPEATDGLQEIAGRLHLMGIHHYSMHPPDKRVLPTLDNLIEWYLDKRRIFTAQGINFALETMYHNPNRPHNLVTLEDVQGFAAAAARHRVVGPLVLDLAHVKISAAAGRWPNPSEVEMLRAGSPWMEVHVSSNNGKLDQHRPFNAQRDSDIAEWLSRIPSDVPRINEGRLR